MTSSPMLPDWELSEAIAYLVSHGLKAKYYPEKAKIYGGTAIIGFDGYMNSFSMTYLKNSWVVGTMIGQIMCHVNHHKLSLATEFVVRLYQETDQFEDESILINDALKRFSASNLDARFESTRMRMGMMQICFGEWHESDCWDGIVIAKRGRCFFAIRVCRPSPVRKLVCARDNLLEVIEFLCTNSGDLKTNNN